MKNKKTIIAVIVLVVLVAVAAVCWFAFGPRAQQGSKTITVEVTAEEKTVVFTVKTDADTVGAALLEHNLIAGDQGDYGLYVKTVNGILADFDVDQTYWSFTIAGEMAMTGVDQTELVDGTVYGLVRTK